jgi:hypothetical protein
MKSPDIFVTARKILPQGNDQVVSIDMSQSDIAGRHEHVLPPRPIDGSAAGLAHIGQSSPPLSDMRQWNPERFQAKWTK